MASFPEPFGHLFDGDRLTAVLLGLLDAGARDGLRPVGPLPAGSLPVRDSEPVGDCGEELVGDVPGECLAVDLADEGGVPGEVFDDHP